MALTEKSIRNIFIYAFPKFIGYGLNLITLPILTRILTPEDFGVIILAWMFPTIAVSILTFGLAPAAHRYYFEYREDEQKLNALMFSSQAILYLFLIVSASVMFFIKDYISELTMGGNRYGFAVFVAFISAYLGQIINFYLLLYQNMERAVIHSSFTVAQALVTTIVSLLLVWYFKMSYMGMIYGSLAGSAIVCPAIFIHFNKSLKIIFKARILFENIKYGLQIIPKSFTSFINRFFDKYMLNNMLSLSAVGVFNIGQTIGNAMFFLMNTVWSSFQPVCYREAFDKGTEGSASLGRLFTIFAYVSLMPLLLLILFAQEIVYLVAPPSYYEAIDIIIIISAGVATQVFGMYVGVQYAYTKKAYWIFPIAVIGTLANVTANIILIPKIGLIGAALSTVISTGVINIILTFIGQKLYKIRYERGTIAVFYVFIASATVSVLYLRHIEFNSIYLYLIKLIFIVLYIFAGIKAKLITGQSIEKVQSALFNFPKRKEV